jgi:hypothetical protein
LLKSFEKEEPEEKADIKKLKKKVVKKPEEKTDIKKKKKLDEGTKEEYIGIDELKQKAEKGDVNKKGEGVFQELESIGKKEKKKKQPLVSVGKKKPVKKIAKAVAKSIPKDKVLPKKVPKMSKKDIFRQLSDMTGHTQEKIKKHVDKDKVTTEDMLKVFAKVTDKKQLNMNVFKAILSRLLSEAKLSKQSVMDIIFEFQEQKLLTDAEAAKILKDLKLM